METEDVKVRRPPGRPRKFGQGRLTTTVRFTPERHEALQRSAAANGRSVSEEVEYRVEQLDHYEQVLGSLDEAKTRIADINRGDTEAALRALGWGAVLDVRYGGYAWVPPSRHNFPPGGWVDPAATAPTPPLRTQPDPEFVRQIVQPIAKEIAAVLRAELKKGKRS